MFWRDLNPRAGTLFARPKVTDDTYDKRMVVRQSSFLLTRIWLVDVGNPRFV
jgi:hypothetical protein